MSGTLALPTDFATVSGNQPATLLATDLSTIVSYINVREQTQGLLSARPAAGTKGAWYFATDTGALYGDNGAAWVLLSLLGGNVAESFTGLGLSYSSTTVLGIAAGAASSNDATIANRVLMTLTAAYTKTTGAWAVGSGNGGVASGSAIAATTWYHVFLIERPDTGVVDVAFDTSVTGANIAANTAVAYTKIRRLGSFLTDGSSHIVSFFQTGDTFLWTVPVLDVNATNPGTNGVSVALASVPTGVIVEALLNVVLFNGTTANLFAWVAPLIQTDAAPSSSVAPLANIGGNTAIIPMTSMRIQTDTSAQIRYRLNASGAADVVRMVTLGWIDRRGRG